LTSLNSLLSRSVRELSSVSHENASPSIVGDFNQIIFILSLFHWHDRASALNEDEKLQDSPLIIDRRSS